MFRNQNIESAGIASSVISGYVADESISPVGSTIGNNIIISDGNNTQSFSFSASASIRVPEGFPSGATLALWVGGVNVEMSYVPYGRGPCIINVSANGTIDIISTYDLRPGSEVLFEGGIIAPVLFNVIGDDEELLDSHAILSDTGTSMISVSEEGIINIEEVDLSSDGEEIDSSDSESDTDDDFCHVHQGSQALALPSQQSDDGTIIREDLLKECALTLSGEAEPLSSDSECEGF